MAYDYTSDPVQITDAQAKAAVATTAFKNRKVDNLNLVERVVRADRSAIPAKASVTAIRNIPASKRYEGVTVVKNGATPVQYGFSATSAAADNGTSVLCPSDITHPAPGRWIDMGGSGSWVAPVAPSVVGDIVTFVGVAGEQQDSGVAITNLPTMAAVGGAGEFVYTAAANKALAKSGVTTANVVQNTTGAAAGPGRVIVSQGANKLVEASTVDSTELVTQAAAGTNHQIPHYNGASKILEDSGVVSTDVVTEAAAASGADQIVTSAGASKVVKDSTVAIANVVTNTTGAAAGADNVVATAGADKTVKATTISTANLVANSTGNATAAEYVIVSAAADKTVKPTTTLVSNLHRAVSIALTSVPNGTLDLAYTLPANSIVTGCSLYVDASAAAGVTLDVGIHGDDDCYLVNVPCDAAPGESFTAIDALLDGTNNWYTGTYGGDALALCVAGTNADDRGLFTTYFDNVVGTPAIAINGSAADAAFRGSIVLTYYQR